MAKKKNQTVTEAEKHESERRQVIAEFNVNNMGKYWIDPDKSPSEDDVNKAKEDFEKLATELNNKKDYVIADKANALRVANFLKNFVENAFWTQRSFVGVLNFSSLIKDFIDNFKEDEPVDLALEYAPLQFAYLMLENYAGVGLKEAERMAELWDEYLPIYEKLHELIDWYNAQAKKVEAYKERWCMFAQGYYLELMEYADENDENETEENCCEAQDECGKNDECCAHDSEV